MASTPPTVKPEFQKLLTLLKSGGDVRQRKVRRLRAALRAARYENELKLTVAIERVMREL